jgi:hypothetical protein
MKKFIPSMVAAVLLAAFISNAWTGSSAAGAADDDNVEFEDNFESLDPGWGEGSSSYGVKDGKFFIALEPQTWTTALNQANVFKELDVTALVTMAKCDDPTLGAGGLVFWAEDYANYYAMLVAGDGRVAVMRHAAGNRLLQAVPWKASEVIKRGVGETNELRVVTKGHVATLYINGSQVATFKGQHPEGGGLVGFMAESWSKEKTRWEFAQLKVVK